MKVHIIKTKDASDGGWVYASIKIGYSWQIGFKIHDWGLRLMLGWWHMCIWLRN